jgi:hypothetical protein
VSNITARESGSALYEFYKKLTASDAPIKERAFMEYYMVERTLSEPMVEHLAVLYSSGDHRAFTLRHFKALHAFNGKEYGWIDLQLNPTFQVVPWRVHFLLQMFMLKWCKHGHILCFVLAVLCTFGGQSHEKGKNCNITNKGREGKGCHTFWYL